MKQLAEKNRGHEQPVEENGGQKQPVEENRGHEFLVSSPPGVWTMK